MLNDNFDPTDYIGAVITLVFWHEPENSNERSQEVRFEGYTGIQDYCHHEMDINTVVRIYSDLITQQGFLVMIGM